MDRFRDAQFVQPLRVAGMLLDEPPQLPNALVQPGRARQGKAALATRPVIIGFEVQIFFECAGCIPVVAQSVADLCDEK